MDTGRCRAASKKLSVSWRMAHLLIAKYSPPVSRQTQTKIASAFFIAYDPITLVQERSPVERLMTCNTSAVAFCRAFASFSSRVRVPTCFCRSTMDGAAVDSLRALGLFARFDHVAAFRHLINRDAADLGAFDVCYSSAAARN